MNSNFTIPYRFRLFWGILFTASLILFSCMTEPLNTNASEARPPTVTLTPEEAAYVASLNTLVVGCPCNTDPILYRYKNEGEVLGITVDILNLVAKRTGLNFRYAALPSGPITYDTLREQHLDLISSVEFNDVNLNVDGLHLTVPYFSSKSMIICKRETQFNPGSRMAVGVVSGSQTIEEIIHRKYPNFDVVFFDTAEKALKAVYNEKIDCMMLNQYAINQTMRKPQYGDLKIISAAGMNNKHCLSPVIYKEEDQVRDETLSNPLLISVLNKGIRSLTEEEVSLIIINQTAQRAYRPTLADSIYRYRFLLTLILFFLIVIAVLIMYVNKMRGRTESLELLKLEQERHQFLIEKTEQIIYELDLVNKKLNASEYFQKKFGWTLNYLHPVLDPKTFLSLWRVHSEDAANLTDFFDRSFKGEKDNHIVVRLQLGKRNYIWCRISQFAMLDSAGHPTQILGLIRDVNQEVLERHRISEESRRDPLTGLLNKHAFKLAMQERLDNAETKDCTLVFLDLDNFKNVNDTMGHLRGDQLIQEIAETLQHFFHDTDLIARFGGDEFFVLLDKMPMDELASLLHDLLAKLNIHCSNEIDTVEVSASIGVTTAAGSGYEVQCMLRNADSALYVSKGEGKNCWNICTTFDAS